MLEMKKQPIKLKKKNKTPWNASPIDQRGRRKHQRMKTMVRKYYIYTVIREKK
jgi:hypothetical protein